MAIIKLTVLTLLHFDMMSNGKLTTTLQSCDATASSCFREGLHALAKQLQQANNRITLLERNQTNQLQQANDRITLLETTVSTLKNELNNSIINTPAATLFRDCAHVYKSGLTRSETYKIYPVDLNNDVHEVTVYCDMLTNGGGWTVFQRRRDGKVLFNRTWAEYKNGFGLVTSEYWLGNKNIAVMTSSSKKKYRLRIDLEAFDGETSFAEYTDFNIAPETDNFRLSIGTYSGTAGDSGRGLSSQNNSMFSTYDRDNDQSSGSCSRDYGNGGFWYNNCYYVSLNGVYYSTAVDSTKSINWQAWGYIEALRKTTMMFRPMDFP